MPRHAMLVFVLQVQDVHRSATVPVDQLYAGIAPSGNDLDCLGVVPPTDGVGVDDVGLARRVIGLYVLFLQDRWALDLDLDSNSDA